MPCVQEGRRSRSDRAGFERQRDSNNCFGIASTDDVYDRRESYMKWIALMIALVMNAMANILV